MLVTAAAGQIGRHLVPELETHGHTVIALDQRRIPVGPRRTVVPGRVKDWLRLSPDLAIDRVVHLEWSGGVREAEDDPAGRWQRAVEPSLALVDWAKSREIPVVFASTCVYEGLDERPRTEFSPINPRSEYVRQKLAVEAALADFGTVLRVFNVYGIGGRNTQIINRILGAARAGQPLRVTGDGEQQRDFVHARDVAAAFRLAVELASPDTVNVGSGVGRSMNQVISAVEHAIGREVAVEYVPAVAAEARYLVADIGRAAARLGWRPTVDFADGLAELVAVSSPESGTPTP